MFLGGDCLKRNWARPVSVALISCRLVSQCLTILSVWPSVWGRGCLWCLTVSGCCLRDPVCCQGGDSIKTSRERSVGVMLFVPQKMPL